MCLDLEVVARCRVLKAGGRPDDERPERKAYALPMKLFVVLILTAALGVVAPSPASAQTPAGYRAELNRLCRGYTPKLRADQRAMQKAIKAKDWKAFGYVLGHYLALALTQDRQIESTPVPRAMRTQMTPILRLFRTADSHARLALRKATLGDTLGMLAELDKISKLAQPLNGRLDRAGLRDCGSNQS
jgi:hypothetical protein